jgi:exosortase
MMYYLLWLLVGALFFPVFAVLFGQRWDALNYTHAYFILPISLWLAFRKREELAEAFAAEEKRFGTGSLAIFVFGALLYLFGWMQDYMVIAAFGLIPFLYGFIGFIYGKKVQKLLVFPILYILLLVPPPFALLDRITLPLRYISAGGVEGIFRLFNFPIQREGLGYVIEGQQMMVDEACSGFRSLITMFSLALVYVYVIRSSIVKKVVLVLSVIPLALIGNIARIIAISLIAVNFSKEAAQGFMHSFSGVVVFLFILMGFVGIEALWGKRDKKEQPEEKGFEWFE